MGVSLACACTDLARGRIYNVVTLPVLGLGLVFSAWTDGWTGARDSVAAALLGLALYGWMFRIGVMGGGDVKLLMALGSWGGPRFTIETAFLALMLGGALALVLLAVKRRLVDFVRRMRRFVLSLAVRELEIETPTIDRKLTMPYGVPIAAAAAWLACGGARPW